MLVIMCRIIFLIVLISSVRSDNQNIVNVRIKNGLIKGRIETSVDGKQLNVFRGIPYAKPPVGDLRFKRPLPIEEWSQPIDAFNLPNVCPQDMTLLKMTGPKDIEMSEDCLYLNIWSPIEKQNTETLKPVMFWIHGGGLTLGSSSEPHYNGEVIASKGDVVVVSINYRLNTLGFLYSGTADAPGNVGLWDQSLALEWVKDNIQYFGGDPDKITIFGESAGAWSVSLHVLSPISRNLFKNAIMNSGAYIFNFMGNTPQHNIKQWLKAAQLIGCSDDQNDNKFTQKIIDCLRKVEVEKLIPLQSLDWSSNVVIDGTFLPSNPIEMLRSGDFNHNINLIASTTGDEGSFLLSMAIDQVKYNPFNPQNMNFSEAFQELSHISEGLRTSKEINNGKEVAKLYFNGLSDNSDFDLLRRTIGIAFGDYLLTCPTILFAKEFYKNTNFKSNVYQYLYNYKSDVEFPLCAKWMGVCHANDILPTFGLPFSSPNKGFTEKDREISAQIIKFITDFAKTGVPTLDGVVWPQFYTIDDNIIAPFYEINSDTTFKLGFKINECEYLWNKYIV